MDVQARPCGAAAHMRQAAVGLHLLPLRWRVRHMHSAGECEGRATGEKNKRCSSCTTAVHQIIFSSVHSIPSAWQSLHIYTSQGRSCVCCLQFVCRRWTERVLPTLSNRTSSQGVEMHYPRCLADDLSVVRDDWDHLVASQIIFSSVHSIPSAWQNLHIYTSQGRSCVCCLQFVCRRWTERVLPTLSNRTSSHWVHSPFVYTPGFVVTFQWTTNRVCASMPRVMWVAR